MYYVRGVRRAGAGGDVGVALRRPPRLGQPHDRRRRARRVDAVLPRRRPGLARRCSARTCCDRWPAPRTSGASSSARSTTVSSTAPCSSPVAPVDLVTANRPHVSPGDRPLPAAGRSSAAAWTATCTSAWPPASRRWRRRSGCTRSTSTPLEPDCRAQGRARRPTCAPPSATCCGRCSTSTSGACPTSWPTPSRRSTPPTAPSTSWPSAGPAASQPGEPHYYRVQGGTLLAEYDNTQRGVNHVHTVWRDLGADFGGDVLAAHYAHAH